MFNYAVNWLKILQENLPLFLHKTKRLDLLQALIKPLKDMHASFLVFAADALQKGRFTMEKIYIEKALNLKYDPIGNGIFIGNSLPNRVIIYQEAELQRTTWVFNEWNSGTAYLIGQTAQEQLGVYKAKTNNTNKQPSANPADWDVEINANSITVIRQDSEFSPATHFIVKVPVAIPYVDAEMRALIDLYNLAGMTYTIITY